MAEITAEVTCQSDKERVLMNIAVDTSGSVHDQMRRLVIGWSLRYKFDRPAPQFVPMELAQNISMPLKPGDIIRCTTNSNHPWGIGEYVEHGKEYSCYVLREIGSDRLLNMRNESIEVLRFMDPHRLYTGKKYQLYCWVHKAFSARYNKDYDYYKKVGDISFNGGQLEFWSRAHVWIYEKREEKLYAQQKLYAQPRRFQMNWDQKTRLKDIVQTMSDQGFEKDFEYGPVEPENSGVVTFTKKSLEKVLGL